MQAIFGDRNNISQRNINNVLRALIGELEQLVFLV